MNILCLNTAFPEAHIALKYDGKCYYEKIDANSKHSENLLVGVEKLFEKIIKENCLKISSSDMLRQLDFLSVVVGPGSFTGLRISIATAKGILVTNPKVKAVGINSLELIANEYSKNNKLNGNICPVIDALSGLYFIAEYNKNLDCTVQPKMITEQELKKCKNLISNDDSLTKNTVILNPETLLELTESKISKNELLTENSLVPLYLRPSQAEAELKCKQKSQK